MIYWAVFHFYIWGPIIWGVFYIIIAGILIGIGVKKNLELKIKIILSTKILLILVLICVVLGIHFALVVVVVTVTIIVLAGVGLIGIYFRVAQDVIPKWVSILIFCVFFIGIVALAVLGLVFDVVSSLAVFTIISGMIEISLLAASFAIYIQKHNKRYEAPHVYSAYGYPIYCFESSK